MDARATRLSIVGARAAFQSDTAWLHALTRAAQAVGRLRSTPPVVVQVRIETQRDDTEPLARQALEALRSHAPTLHVGLNAQGVDADAGGYDGVHWPERHIPEHRPASEGSASASVHSLAALQRAERAGVDWVHFGPIWTPTWKALVPRGTDALTEISRVARVPVIAVGGVEPRRVAACLAAGAHGVAVVSGVLGAAEIDSALRQYLDALGSDASCRLPPRS